MFLFQYVWLEVLTVIKDWMRLRLFRRGHLLLGVHFLKIDFRAVFPSKSIKFMSI